MRKIRRAVPLLLVAIVAAAVYLGTRSDEPTHRLRLRFDHALYIEKGTQVRAAGRPVGSVTGVSTPRSGGYATVDVEIRDPAAWPLPVGTRFRLRELGTISYGERYVELTRPRGAGRKGDLRDGALVAGAAAPTPVELDDIFPTFDAKGRRDLRATLDRGGAALAPAAKPLAQVVHRAPGALDEARAVLDDLGDDGARLNVLLTTGAAVLDSIRRANPGLDSLLTNAATTFTALASRSGELRAALQDAPSTLRTTDRTLGRAEATLRDASVLTRRLAPGVRELRRTIAPLDGALRTIAAVGPDATSALRSVRIATPDLDTLLTRATDVLPSLETTGTQLATQLACIRPYAPEIAGFASTWSSFISVADSKDKLARVNLPVNPIPNISPLDSQQVTQLLPQLRYAFPRPPGESVGQPWFIPECGVGPDAVDPTKDPEAAR